jgi:hypothetical protein
MKRHLAMSVVLLLASLPSFGSHSQPSVSSQIKLKHPHSFDGAARKNWAHKPGSRSTSNPIGHPAVPSARPVVPGNTSAQAHPAKTRKFSSTAAAPASLVSATQIPMGGEDDGSPALMGDFNGDGKKDVVKMTYTQTSGTVYSISVLLSNGDGTFQAAQLTAAPNNVDDPIIVGDVNGDGKDDIIMVHNSGACAASAARKIAPPTFGCGSTFDVLLSNGDGTFTLGNNYSISNYNLNGGLLTDINGDGKLDILAIDSENPALVIEVLGNGDGTFQAPATYATLSGAAPNDINFADFNGDGKLDFEGTVSNQVMVYLASGSGFLSPVPLVTSDTVYDTCGESTGDLNGDGKPEIVSVNCGDNTLTVYLNNGDGSFQTGAYYDNAGDTYMYAGTATIADVNGDGKNDVLTASYYAGSITVFLGNGDGTITSPTVGYSTGGNPYTAPLVADFNGDGLADIMVPDDWFSLVYLEGYGDGTFRSGVSYYLPQSFSEYAYSYGVASGDFNGDGIPDIVAGQDGNTNAPGVVVYLSNGDGTMQQGVTYGTSASLAYVAVADFNGDGKLDIVASDYANGVVQIFLGNGDGTFTVGQSYATDTLSSPYPQNLITGDFNHDGKVDLAIANGSSHTIGVLLGVGDGTFGQLANYSLSNEPYAIAAADLNGDGYLDLAVTAYNDSASNVDILLGNSDNSGTFQAEVDIATGTGYPEFVALGDLNGDGKLDMAVTMQNGPIYYSALVVALGNGDGTFQAPVAYPSSTQGGGLLNTELANVQMADFNGDGKLDLIYVNYDLGTVGIMTGVGDGTLNSPVEFPTSGYVWGMTLADVNNDGAMDVVMGNNYVGGVSVLLNGNGSGTQQNYTLATQTPSQTVTAGSSATYDLSLMGTNLYNGTITFACTGLPAKSACAFSPSSVVAQGNLPLSTTLTISTTAATTALVGPVGPNPNRPNDNPGAPTFLASSLGLGLFGLVLASGGKNRRKRQMAILLGIMFLVMMITLVGCDNDSSTTPTGTSGTPAGSYTVTVTSTGTGTNAPTHAVNVTLVVQ